MFATKARSKAVFRGIVALAVFYLLCVLAAASLSAQSAPPSQAVPAKKPAASAAGSSAAKKPTPPKDRYANSPLATRKIPVGSAAHPLMAEQVFTNIKVLKGIPATEFMSTMGFFSASLVETCTYCHADLSGGSWPHYADDDNPLKNTARQMIIMTNNINKEFFAGRQGVTCFSCHHGTEQPESLPQLSLQYAAPVMFEPPEITEQNPNAPPPDQILDKYIRALGGADRIASLTSYVAKGSYEGYSTILRGTAELYVKAPNQETLIFHTASGDATLAINGKEAWVAGTEDNTPFPVIAMSGADLEGLKADAQLAFPAQIKGTLTKWRTGKFQTINDRKVQVIQGSLPSGEPVKLYFDDQTGLLVREVRYIKNLVGYDPYQIDYGNYKTVSGIQMPMHMVITWTDGRNTMDFSDVQINVPIDAAKFNQPAPPKFIGNEANTIGELIK